MPMSVMGFFVVMLCLVGGRFVCLLDIRKTKLRHMASFLTRSCGPVLVWHSGGLKIWKCTEIVATDTNGSVGR